MAQNKIFNSQPAVIATAGMTTACNLFNSAITTLTATAIGWAATQPYAIIKHIHVDNTLTTTAINVSIYKGTSLTTASTAAMALSTNSIAAGSYADWYGQARFDSGDYLTGLCSLPVAAVITMEGEVGLA